MIGYYAHSHGSGHCNYAHIFSKVFGKSLTIFTDRSHSFDTETEVVMLENEDPDGTEFERNLFPEPRALHYAPVNLSKITRRNRLLLDTITRKNIGLLIIDVSVEIAMLARVSSIPYAYVRLHGDRNDLPHLNAYEGASMLLAYYPREMESRDTASWIRKKTVYLGLLSRYMLGSGASQTPSPYPNGKKPVLVYFTGFGGSRLVDFGTLSTSYDMYSVGPGSGRLKTSLIRPIGTVDCTRAYIEHADIIVAACGSNTTSEILSLGKRFVAVSERRHFREQERMAENLDRMGWAVDLSKQSQLMVAVTNLEKIKNRELPAVSLKPLIAFQRKLDFLGGRADRFMEWYKKEGAEFETKTRPTVSPTESKLT